MDYFVFLLIALGFTTVIIFALLGTIIFLEMFKRCEHEENEDDEKE